MGRLMRRFRECDAGQALAEYGVLLALVALGLLVALGTLRRSVGGVTDRTSVAITTRAAGGYGTVPGPPAPPRPSPAAPRHDPAPADPDSSAGEAPDSTGSGPLAGLID